MYNWKEEREKLKERWIKAADRHDRDGVVYPILAKEFGVSENRIKQLVARGRKELQKHETPQTSQY